jgi:hypothetical protein
MFGFEQIRELVFPDPGEAIPLPDGSGWTALEPPIEVKVEALEIFEDPEVQATIQRERTLYRSRRLTIVWHVTTLRFNEETGEPEEPIRRQFEQQRLEWTEQQDRVRLGLHFRFADGAEYLRLMVANPEWQVPANPNPQLDTEDFPVQPAEFEKLFTTLKSTLDADFETYGLLRSDFYTRVRALQPSIQYVVSKLKTMKNMKETLDPHMPPSVLFRGDMKYEFIVLHELRPLELDLAFEVSIHNLDQCNVNVSIWSEWRRYHLFSVAWNITNVRFSRETGDLIGNIIAGKKSDAPWGATTVSAFVNAETLWELIDMQYRVAEKELCSDPRMPLMAETVAIAPFLRLFATKKKKSFVKRTKFGCEICGQPSVGCCAGCKTKFYCGRLCQSIDFVHNRHQCVV